MKKDKKMAEFIRNKLTDLICTEYNRYDASYEDHLILVNSIHDIYKLYTPNNENNKFLCEWLSNVIDQKHVMINYPPKDDEFIDIKRSYINKFYIDLNDKFDNNDFTITYSKNSNLPALINITFKITDHHTITFSDNIVYITEEENLISQEYDTYIPKKLKDKINLFTDNIHRNFDDKYYRTGVKLLSNDDAVNYIYHNILSFKNKPIKTEKWVYDKSLIQDDDKFYIFRVRSNFLSDNDNDTMLTTWRNICEKGYKFIAFQEMPLRPMRDFVNNGLIIDNIG